MSWSTVSRDRLDATQSIPRWDLLPRPLVTNLTSRNPCACAHALLPGLLQNLIKQNNKMLTKAAMMGQQAQMNQKSAAQNHQKPGQQKRREGNVGQPRGKGGSH